MSIDISLIILTWNRWNSVERSLPLNLATANYQIRELIHVDNGSEPGFVERFRQRFNPTVQIVHASNEGVAKGYNRGLAVASGSHVVITGCDRVMPANWLSTWVNHLEAIPQTGVISCYSQYEQHNHQTSRLRELIRVSNYVVRRALPVEARIHSREFLFKTGFWREDFGLYGYEDAEWADRADRVAREHGLINYVIPDMPYARHIDDADFTAPVGARTYQQFKKETHTDPRLRALYRHCRAFDSPYYNPFYRIEPTRLLEKESP